MAETVDFSGLNSKLDELISALEDNTAARAGGTGGSGGGDGTNQTDSQKFATEAIKAIGKIGFDISNEVAKAGRRLANTIGTTFVDGIRLEAAARTESINQLRKYSVNIAATAEQIQAVQKSAADAFVNLPAGFALSSDATAEFASKLKKIFGGEFDLTSETLRNFAILGLTTTDSIQQFKNETGRAGLSTQQYDRIVNKNIASLLIFGNSSVKSAIALDRIGISLEQYRAVQQGTVTNLEGTLDTINQLNQLGAQIDFGTFVRISELGTPEETFRYLQNTIPTALLRTSTSFRALTEQLSGVKAEDLLRGGAESAVDAIERQFLDLSGPDGALAKFAASIQAATQALSNVGASPGRLSGAGGAIGSLIGGVLAKRAAAAAGTTALRAVFAGIGGATLGGLLGGFILPALAIGGLTAIMGDDVVSGYGNRTLLTPKGSIALNNDDTLIAGTNLFRNQSNSQDTSMLIRKVDALIDTIASANTTVQVGSGYQTVPRVGLVGIHTRFDQPGGSRV